MDKTEIQREIKRLERQLTEYKKKHQKAKKDSEKLLHFIDKVNTTKRAYENGLNSVLARAKQSSSKLSTHNRYRERYNNETARILKGKEAVNAIDSLQRGSAKAKQATIDSEENAKNYNKKIAEIQRKIEELKTKLNTEEK